MGRFLFFTPLREASWGDDEAPDRHVGLSPAGNRWEESKSQAALDGAKRLECARFIAALTSEARRHLDRPIPFPAKAVLKHAHSRRFAPRQAPCLMGDITAPEIPEEPL